MTEEALALAYERAAGVCECIGGGCPSLSHRPGVNRCSAGLGSAQKASFFAVSRFADQTDAENLYVVCAACAANPRRRSQRVAGPAGVPSADTEDDSLPTV